MPFGHEFSEKLVHVLGAAALYCVAAKVAPEIAMHAGAEAMLGVPVLGSLLARWRVTKADALIRRCARQVESGSDALLQHEYRDDPDAPARRDEAVAAIRDVLPRIEPQPEEIVAARLTSERVVAFYLDRAAEDRPDMFGAKAHDDMARRLLGSVIGNAWQLILRQPEFEAEVLRETLRELLIGQDELRHGQQAIRDDVAALPDTIEERVIAVLEARGIVRTAEAAGLERRTMLRIAGRLRPDENLGFDQAVVEVEHAVGIALEVIARGERGGNLDAFVETVLRRLAETTRAGEFDRGSLAVDDALRELARREVEQVDVIQRSRTALLEAGIEQDTLRRDAAAVARRIEALVAAGQPGERAAWTPAFRQRWDALYEEGRDKGINLSLEVAEALARCLLDAAHDSDERGAAGNLLGNALTVLGERERGTTRLEQAVEAFRAALEEYTRERVPLDWAMTQNNLGAALQTLGERESGSARLEQAVEAYHAALQEYTRERVPLDWATTQNNLGIALARLGERESGEARLEQAIEAYRVALEERTRERVPLDWAMTQNNLGNALQTLGKRESGTVRLEQAVEAYRAALEERTRERVPLNWATTQNNLGNALRTLGERESGTARLEQAVEAYRAALEERMRARVPLDWAATQNNLGTALRALGECESGTARLEQAVAAYRAALEEYTRERVPLNWAYSQHTLGNALAILAARTHDPALTAEALGCMRGAAEVYREAGNTYWLPFAERRIGEMEAQLHQLQRQAPP